MSLRNKKIIDKETILNNSKTRDIEILLMEEILSDNSKVYNIEIIFYAAVGCQRLLTLEDVSCTSFKDASETWMRIIEGLSVLKNSEIV